MNFLKKLFNFIKKPPVWFAAALCIPAACALAAGSVLLTRDIPQPPGLACISVGGILTAYLIYAFIKLYPDIKRKTLAWAENRPFFGRLFQEYGYRALILTVGSFAVNTAFAVYNGVIAVIIGSVWFGALAAYYILLITVRGGILLYHAGRRRALKRGLGGKDARVNDAAVYGLCGGALILMPVALSFAVLQTALSDASFVHTGITIYAYAAYAFYKITIAIYNFVKTRNTDEFTVRAVKNVSLADAMVTILALQTAMFREFGTGMSDFDITAMNATTGGVVCALTAATGVFMLVYAAVFIKRFKKAQGENGGDGEHGDDSI